LANRNRLELSAAPLGANHRGGLSQEAHVAARSLFGLEEPGSAVIGPVLGYFGRAHFAVVEPLPVHREGDVGMLLVPQSQPEDVDVDDADAVAPAGVASRELLTAGAADPLHGDVHPAETRSGAELVGRVLHALHGGEIAEAACATHREQKQ